MTLPVIELACPCSYCPEKINKEWGLEGHDRQRGLAAIPLGEAGPFTGGLPLSSPGPQSQARGQGNAKGMHMV